MSKLPILGLDVFLAVARRGSIRGAATDLQVQPSTISHQLKSLETRIGVTLFARTTRSVSLTDAGRVLLRSAMPAFEQLEQAVEQAQKTHGVLRGELRINMPYIAYQIALAEHLSDFQRTYPEIGLDFTMSDQLVDIVAEGFHAGIRFGGRVQQDMIAVQISPPNVATAFASSAYLRAHGEPETPADLLAHNCLRYRFISSKRLADWDFDGPDGPIAVEVRGTLVTDSQITLVNRALAGHGVIHVPSRFVQAHVDDGALVPIL
ncbi:MAG: LysR family transcriptional regulator, partial [Pseudomonadota bacterium]